MNPRTVLHRTALALTSVGSLVPGIVTAGAGAGSPPAAAGAATPPAAPGVDVSSLRRTWSWPLTPRPEVLAAFVAPHTGYGAGHRGIDLVAAQGQQVRAVEGGVVTHVGMVAGRGTVTVTHASGLRSTYEPVQGAVATGQAVAEGDLLGVVHGRSHCGARCLHLGALVGSGYVDPRPLLGGGPVVLLPLGPGQVALEGG